MKQKSPLCLIPFIILFLSLCVTCMFIDDLNHIALGTGYDMKVRRPAGGEEYELDSDMEIRWDIGKGSVIRIDLLKEGEVVRTLADSFPINEPLDWIGIDEPDGVYTIRCTILDDGPYYGTSCESGEFAITSWIDLDFPGLSFSSNVPEILCTDDKIIVTIAEESEDIMNPSPDDFRIHVYEYRPPSWVDLGCPDTIKSFTYSMILDPDLNPVIYYSWFVKGTGIMIDSAFTTKIASYDYVAWREEEINNPDEGDEEGVAASIVFLEPDNPLYMYLTPPGFASWTAEDWYLRAKKLDTTDHSVESLYNGECITTSKITFIEDFIETFKLLNTSKAVDKNGTLYLAYSDSTGEGVLSFSVVAFTDETTNTWEKLPHDIPDEINYFSMAINGASGAPVVAYNNNVESTTEVIQWNNTLSVWEEIGSFPISEILFPPAIIQDTDGILVLAYCHGVRKYNNPGGATRDEQWEDLGSYGYGVGDPSYWIGSNNSLYVVAYRYSNGIIRVKKKDKEQT